MIRLTVCLLSPGLTELGYCMGSPRHTGQCLSQDLETGCLKLAVVKFLGVQNFKGDHNILMSKP